MEGMNEIITPVTVLVFKYLGGSIVTGGFIVFVWWISKVTGKKTSEVLYNFNLTKLHKAHIAKINSIHSADKKLHASEMRMLKEEIKKRNLQMTELKEEVSNMAKQIEAFMSSSNEQQKELKRYIERDAAKNLIITELYKELEEYKDGVN